MNSLVEVRNGEPTVSSLRVAEHFGKAHRDVLRSISNLSCSEKFSLRNFAQSEFKNSRGKTIPVVHMTKDGFTFLCMGFTGEKAGAWKEAYIEAFNAMEKALSRKSEAVQWKQASLQLKAVRREVTDCIKDFVEYATRQGSKSASMYYKNITKMEYAALELVENGSKVPDGFRDTLDLTAISYLQAAETRAKQALVEGMKAGMHYKEIYLYAKQAVNALAGAIKAVPAITAQGETKCND